MAYSNTSPYFATKLQNNYLGVMTFRNIPALDSDVEYEIFPQYENRPDLLAYDLYGDVNLWWVFSVRNKDIIKDPIYDMYPGQKIKLPTLETLKAVLGF